MPDLLSGNACRASRRSSIVSDTHRSCVILSSSTARCAAQTERNKPVCRGRACCRPMYGYARHPNQTCPRFTPAKPQPAPIGSSSLTPAFCPHPSPRPPTAASPSSLSHSNGRGKRGPQTRLCRQQLANCARLAPLGLFSTSERSANYPALPLPRPRVGEGGVGVGEGQRPPPVSSTSDSFSTVSSITRKTTERECGHNFAAFFLGRTLLRVTLVPAHKHTHIPCSLVGAAALRPYRPYPNLFLAGAQ